MRTDFERPERELLREEFCERLAHILGEQFPDETVESITASADLGHSLSGNYARGVLKRGSAHTAFLAVPDGETQDTINNSLTLGLLWLDRLQNGSRRGTISALRLIVPKDTCSIVAHRIASLSRNVAIELYERDAREELEKINARRPGNLQTWLVPRREPEALLKRCSGDYRASVGCFARGFSALPRNAVRGWDEGNVHSAATMRAKS